MLDEKPLATNSANRKGLSKAIYCLIFFYLLFPSLGFDLSFMDINTKFPFVKIVALFNILAFAKILIETKKGSIVSLSLPLLGFAFSELIFSSFSLNSNAGILSAVNDVFFIYFFAALLLRMEFSRSEICGFYLFARGILSLVCILLILESIFDRNLYIELMPDAFYGGKQYAWLGMQQRLGKIRAIGPYGQAIGASIWAGVNIGLYLFLPTKKHWYKVLGLAISFIGLFCTLSRGGIIGTFILVIIFSFIYLIKKGKLRIKLAGVLASGLLLWSSFAISPVRALTWGSMFRESLPSDFREREEYTLEAGNFEDRWLSSFEIIAFYFAHPFDILGAGSLRYGGKGQIFYGLSRVKYVTNLYSVLLIEVGIFAVLFYILFIYKVFKLTHRNINRNDERRRYFLVGLYVLGIYTLNTLALQVMLDPIYLLLILLPFTIREKLNRAYAAPSSDLFVARAAGI